MIGCKWRERERERERKRWYRKKALTMETILIITKKEMFPNNSRNYIRNKVRKFKNPFFDISFNLI